MDLFEKVAGRLESHETANPLVCGFADAVRVLCLKTMF